MRRTAKAFAQARFGFSTQLATSSALYNLRKQIEDFNGGPASITAEGILPTHRKINRLPALFTCHLTVSAIQHFPSTALNAAQR